MPRTLKNTRIKSLPPKLKIRALESLSGSYPTHARISSDNRTGVYKTFFDDGRTIQFTSSVPSVNMPVGLPISDPSLYIVNQAGTMVINNELTTSIQITTTVDKGFVDSFVSLQRSGQEFQGFRDNDNPAVDGILSNSSFYATGSAISDVGEGFDQPVWSKSKFEIDLSTPVSCQFAINNYLSASDNFPMAYWNNVLKTWQGIGPGTEFANYGAGTTTAFEQFFEDQCIGFVGGFNYGSLTTDNYSVGAKTSDFGFPYHPKFHATSSNLVAMSSYISEPFLLEKIVLEWNGKFEFNNTYLNTTTPYTVNTFFILNQRSPFSYGNPAVQAIVYSDNTGNTHYLATGSNIPTTYNNNFVNTSRDLVSFAQISGTEAGWTPVGNVLKDLNIFYGDPRSVGSNGAWNGQMEMSASIRNPMSANGLDSVQIGSGVGNHASAILINQNSTRSGLFVAGGRSLLAEMENFNIVSQSINIAAAGGGPAGVVNIQDKYYRTNPYLLLPTDELVFGWQLPIAPYLNDSGGSKAMFQGLGPQLIFNALPSKITFYGSQIKEGVEFHDTLNQLLSSTTINETIE